MHLDKGTCTCMMSLFVCLFWREEEGGIGERKKRGRERERGGAEGERERH